MSLLFWRKTKDTGVYRPDGVADTINVEVGTDNPLPVQLVPGDDAEVQPVGIADTSDALPSTPSPFNLTLTTADTEYSVPIPAGCKQFEWQCRTEVAVRYAYETGRVATPSGTYDTCKAGDYYYSGLLGNKHPSFTLFLASGTAGVVVEGTIWT